MSQHAVPTLPISSSLLSLPSFAESDSDNEETVANSDDLESFYSHLLNGGDSKTLKVSKGKKSSKKKPKGKTPPAVSQPSTTTTETATTTTAAFSTTTTSTTSEMNTTTTTRATKALGAPVVSLTPPNPPSPPTDDPTAHALWLKNEELKLTRKEFDRTNNWQRTREKRKLEDFTVGLSSATRASQLFMSIPPQEKGKHPEGPEDPSKHGEDSESSSSDMSDSDDNNDFLEAENEPSSTTAFNAYDQNPEIAGILSDLLSRIEDKGGTKELIEDFTISIEKRPGGGVGSGGKDVYVFRTSRSEQCRDERSDDYCSCS